MDNHSDELKKHQSDEANSKEHSEDIYLQVSVLQDDLVRGCHIITLLNDTIIQSDINL